MIIKCSNCNEEIAEEETAYRISCRFTMHNDCKYCEKCARKHGPQNQCGVCCSKSCFEKYTDKCGFGLHSVCYVCKWQPAEACNMCKLPPNAFQIKAMLKQQEEGSAKKIETLEKETDERLVDLEAKVEDIVETIPPLQALDERMQKIEDAINDLERDLERSRKRKAQDDIEDEI